MGDSTGNSEVHGIDYLNNMALLPQVGVFLFFNDDYFEIYKNFQENVCILLQVH